MGRRTDGQTERERERHGEANSRLFAILQTRLKNSQDGAEFDCREI